MPFSRPFDLACHVAISPYLPPSRESNERRCACPWESKAKSTNLFALRLVPWLNISRFGHSHLSSILVLTTPTLAPPFTKTSKSCFCAPTTHSDALFSLLYVCVFVSCNFTRVRSSIASALFFAVRVCVSALKNNERTLRGNCARSTSHIGSRCAHTDTLVGDLLRETKKSQVVKSLSSLGPQWNSQRRFVRLLTKRNKSKVAASSSSFVWGFFIFPLKSGTTRYEV